LQVSFLRKQAEVEIMHITGYPWEPYL
jgi:hypothetical protein